MLSIILPLYNQWPLTRQCLEALAGTLAGDDDTEIIAVDNASSDETPQACPVLGDALFGGRFRCLRQEENRNFSGANNIGAAAARGEWLFLLNNDTIPLPGWKEPLMRAAAGESGIGAAGSLLLHPEDSRGIRRVQHLGVALSCGNQATHLYELFPEGHPLASRRRSLQVITGAAMLVSRETYLKLGGLDEDFRNGFEDIEFCARLCAAGFRQTVAPESRIIHLVGRSEGRRAHEDRNAVLCREKSRGMLRMDEAALWRGDGLVPRLSPWLTLEAALPPEREAELLRSVRDGDDALRAAVLAEPLWISGALLLARRLEEKGRFQDAADTLILAARLRGTPETLVPLACFLGRIGAGSELADVRGELRAFILTPEERVRRLTALRDELREADAEPAAQAGALLADVPAFFRGPGADLERAVSEAMP